MEIQIIPASASMVKAQNTQSICASCNNFSDCDTKNLVFETSADLGVLTPIMQCNSYEE